MTSPAGRGDRTLALVTGVGRAAGIGAAVVGRLARDGWDVAYTFHSPYDERVHGHDDAAGRAAVEAQARAAGARVAGVPADPADVQEVARLFAAVRDRMGRFPRSRSGRPHPAAGWGCPRTPPTSWRSCARGREAGSTGS